LSAVHDAPKLDVERTVEPVRGALLKRLLTTLSRETSSGRFIPEMDGLRLVAISMVVLFHLHGYLLAKFPFYAVSMPPAGRFARTAATWSHGVELFFVISGFILALPFAAHHLRGAKAVSLRKYYLRRVSRLEPPYFVTLGTLFVLAVWLQGRNATALLPHLGASFFYLHNLVYGMPSAIVGVAWSLEIEIQFYLLVPLLTLVFAIRRRSLRRSIMGGIVVALIAVQSPIAQLGARASLSLLAYLQFFLVGFLLADVFLTDWNETPPTSVAWDAVSFIGWPLALWSLRWETVAEWTFPLAIFLLYTAAFRGRFSRRVFSQPVITAVGGMCYSIYLLHYEVISGVGTLWGRLGLAASNWFGLALLMVATCTSILLVCGLYFVFLEKPCMRPQWWCGAGCSRKSRYRAPSMAQIRTAD